jgi:hypothetical protein
MSCIQMYYVCVFIDINRTERALPMSCIQMYYVCVFTDIIGQTGHYQCPAYKCTMCVSSLTIYVNKDTHIAQLYTGHW